MKKKITEFLLKLEIKDMHLLVKYTSDYPIKNK